MILIDAKEKFAVKRIYQLDAEKLYAHHLEITRNNPLLICQQSVHYAKAFVQHYPLECIRIIRIHENRPFTLTAWGEEYLELLSAIAAYHLDRKEITVGLLWAVKALDLVDFFAPNLNRSIREKVLYNMIASSMVCAYPKDFNQYASDRFFLEWELKCFNYSGGKNHFNDN